MKQRVQLSGGFKTETLKSKKERLQKELNEISDGEFAAMVAREYPKFKAAYEGKYFKSRNSYGSESKPWWLYTKVTAISPEDIYDTGHNGPTSHFTGYSFQLCDGGHVHIEQSKRYYVHCIGKEISEEEFNKAWNKIMDTLSNLP